MVLAWCCWRRIFFKNWFPSRIQQLLSPAFQWVVIPLHCLSGRRLDKRNAGFDLGVLGWSMLLYFVCLWHSVSWWRRSVWIKLLERCGCWLFSARWRDSCSPGWLRCRYDDKSLSDQQHHLLPSRHPPPPSRLSQRFIRMRGRWASRRGVAESIGGSGIRYLGR